MMISLVVLNIFIDFLINNLFNKIEFEKQKMEEGLSFFEENECEKLVFFREICDRRKWKNDESMKKRTSQKRRNDDMPKKIGRNNSLKIQNLFGNFFKIFLSFVRRC